MERGEVTMNGTAAYPPIADPRTCLSYHGLKLAPFRASADPEHPWFGDTQRALIDTLAAAIRRRGGIFVLTGDIGAGKTTVAKALGQMLDAEGLRVARVADPGRDISDLFQAIASTCGMKDACETRDALIAGLQQVLAASESSDGRMLLVIDEAQGMSPELLEEIRELSVAVPSLAILLVGQKDLTVTLADLRSASVRQHIVTTCALDALTPDEVVEYIRHRLRLAGTDRSIFTADAIGDIASSSGGAPRVINTICDRALVAAHARQLRVVDRELLADCVEKLGMGRRDPAVRESAWKPRRLMHDPGTWKRRRRAGGTGRRLSVSLLAAGLAIAAGYALYAAWPGRVSIETMREAPAAATLGDRRDQSGDEPNTTAAPAPAEAADTGGPKGPSPVASRKEVAPAVIPKPVQVTDEEKVIPARTRELKSKVGPSRAAAGLSESKVSPPRAAAPPAEIKPTPPRAPANVEGGDPTAIMSATPAPRSRTREKDPESSDPGSVIDWLLKEQPSRQR